MPFHLRAFKNIDKSKFSDKWQNTLDYTYSLILSMIDSYSSGTGRHPAYSCQRCRRDRKRRNRYDS
jgi:hypothetical protein